MRGLSLRTRVFLALATVAVLPVTLFGLLAVAQANLLLGDEQADDLALVSTMSARQLVGSSIDVGTAQRLAAQIGRQVTLFAGGSVLADAGGERTIAPPPSDLTLGGEPQLARRGSVLTAYLPFRDVSQRSLVLALTEDTAAAPPVAPALLATLALTAVVAVFISYGLARNLLGPVADLTTTLDRLHAGDLSARMPVESEDELGRLAESHNRLADALASRNRSLAAVLQAVARLSPRAGVAALVATAERAASDAFGFTDARVVLGEDPPPLDETDERVPGEAYEVRVPLAIGDDRVGYLVARRPPTRDWSAADEDLATLFGSQLAAAVRNAELFGATEELSELKSEFLRGVSHNLQTPLTSIRAFAEQIAEGSEDRRLGIIVEQAERLSRLVAQLLTVSKLEAGTLRPDVDVFALGPLVQRAWESLGRDEHPFRLVDEVTSWLVVADPDWVEQVVWALLDNALKYGGEGPIEARLRLDDGMVVTTVRDQGPGIPRSDRGRVFERFARLGRGGGDGSGLGLSVARGLVEGSGGKLWLEQTRASEGAAFSFSLPAERIEES
jgi:signal transduction histidine kinase/HAMP domain-containing protein